MHLTPTGSFPVGSLLVGLCLSLPVRPVEAADRDHAAEREQPDVAATSKVIAVTLDRALELAVQRGPELGPARAAQAGASELERQSRAVLLRPPELSIALGPRFYGEATGVDASMTLLQPLALGGTRAARGRLSAARSESARAAIGAARARAALAAGIAWVDARVAGELVRTRSQSLREAEELDELAAVRLGSGATTAGERALARTLLGIARARLLEVEGGRFTANAELAFHTGLSAEGLVATGQLELDGPAITEAEVLARAERHSHLGYLQAEERVLRRSVEQVRAEGGPFLSVGPSLTREATGDLVILGHVSMALPFLDSNAFEAAERGRQALVAGAELVRERQRLRTDAVVVLHERLHARSQRDALARDALEPARVALDEATLQYREGKAPLFELLAARRTLTEAEERWIEAAGAARSAELRLLWTLGRLVPGVP